MISQHLEKLVHFVGVVKSGSIRKYTLSQNLSQPAISKCIQNLEEALEVTLLTRGQRGVELTLAGQELFQWADQTLCQASLVESSIRKKNNFKLHGKVKMGTYQSIAIYFVPRFFKFLQNEHEDLQLEISNAPSSELVKLLKSGYLDFIVSVDPPSGPELYVLPLFEDRYSLYRSKDSMRRLKDSPIFTVPDATDRHGTSLSTSLEKAGFKNQVIACGDFEGAKAMLEFDSGIALLPERVAKSLLDSQKIEELRQPRNLNHFGPHVIAFSCKKHRAIDASLKWIADQLYLMLHPKT